MSDVISNAGSEEVRSDGDPSRGLDDTARMEETLDDKARMADTVIRLLEEDVRVLRGRLAAEMVRNNRDKEEARLRKMVRQLKKENSILVEEKSGLTRRLAAKIALPGRR